MTTTASPRRVPQVVADHFGIAPTAKATERPYIVSTFTPGVGWREFPWKRISNEWVRDIAEQAPGITALALWTGDRRHGRTADFQMIELVS